MSEEPAAAEVRYGEWYPDPRRTRTTERLRRLTCFYCPRILGRQEASTIGVPPLYPATIWLDANLSLDRDQSARRGVPVYERSPRARGRDQRPRPRRELGTTPRRPDGTARTVERLAGPHPGETEIDGAGRTVWCREQAQAPFEVRCACGAWLRVSGRRPGDPTSEWDLFPPTPATFVVDPVLRSRRRKRPAEPVPEFFDNFSHVISARPKRGAGGR